MIDPGASETAAVADINGDGKPDIVSGEYWYEAPEVGQAPLPRDRLHQQLRRRFQRPADGRERRRARRHRELLLVRQARVVERESRQDAARCGRTMPIETRFNVEFAFLVDLDNDGKAREVLPEFGNANAPLTWYEARDGEFVPHVVRRPVVRARHRRGRRQQGRPHRHHHAHRLVRSSADPRTGTWKFHARLPARRDRLHPRDWT